MATKVSLCPLTGKTCLQSPRFDGPCSATPSLDDAAICIGLAAEHIEDLNNELGAMDEWVEKLRAQSDEGPHGDRKPPIPSA